MSSRYSIPPKPIYLSKRKKREKTFHLTQSGIVVCNDDFTYQRAQVKSKREEIEAQTEHTDFATHLRFYFPFTWSGHWELDKVHSCHFVIFIVNISPFLLFGEFHSDTYPKPQGKNPFEFYLQNRNLHNVNYFGLIYKYLQCRLSNNWLTGIISLLY